MSKCDEATLSELSRMVDKLVNIYNNKMTDIEIELTAKAILNITALRLQMIKRIDGGC